MKDGTPAIQLKRRSLPIQLQKRIEKEIKIYLNKDLLKNDY